MSPDANEAASEDALQLDMSSRTMSRVDNAEHHFARAQAVVDDWAARPMHLWIPAAIVHNGEKLVLRVFHPPQHYERVVAVDLAISDAIHNLRVALDALAMELANHFGSPQNEKDIFFPYQEDCGKDMAQRDAKFRKHAAKLGSVPRQIIDRIRDLQPWSHPPLWIPNFLGLLKELDNADKHRFGVQVSLAPRWNGFLDENTIRHLGPESHHLLDANSVWIDHGVTNLNAVPWRTVFIRHERVTIMLHAGAFGSGDLTPIAMGLADDVTRAIYYIATGTWIDPRSIPGHTIGDDLLPVKDVFLDPRREQAKSRASRPITVKTALSETARAYLTGTS